MLCLIVDGDPHFVVQLPKLRQNLCFTVDGRANDVLRLLEDPERGTLGNKIPHLSVKIYMFYRYFYI